MKRGQPAPRARYQDYKEDLRADFYYSCAYCTITELEATGISFEIDHYLPQSHFPHFATTYGNLVYSCNTCNGYKSDIFPGSPAIKKGFFFYRPDRPPEPSYQLTGYQLTPSSPLDEFNIAYLFLNRAPLIKIREFRDRLNHTNEYIKQGVHGLKKLRLDQFHPTVRGRLPAIKTLAGELARLSEEVFRELAADHARSELLDADPNRKAAVAERKKKLQAYKAILPKS